MYDMTKIKERYWQIRLRTGKVLNIEVPKLKVLKRITKLSKVADTNNMTEEDMENLITALSIALSRNREQFKISEQWIEENININDVQDILNKYFEWVSDIQNLKN
ncbi:MAG: hypothetical protein V8R81_01630 [Clostridia bacterium]